MAVSRMARVALTMVPTLFRNTTLLNVTAGLRTPGRLEPGLAITKEPKCSSDGVREAQVVFRPDGGPVYWLRLETHRDNEAEDVTFLGKVSSSFQLIRWQ